MKRDSTEAFLVQATHFRSTSESNQQLSPWTEAVRTQCGSQKIMTHQKCLKNDFSYQSE